MLTNLRGRSRPAARRQRRGFRPHLEVLERRLLMTAAPPAYLQTNLVSDQAGQHAQVTDANLVNPWGLAFGPHTGFWVANNGSNTSTVYSGDVNHSAMVDASFVVSLPPGPTGAVYNPTSDFRAFTSSTPFIFASEEGKIIAWTPSAGSSGVTMAIVPGAVYKGLTLTQSGGANYLCAANFHAGTIDVFDANYAQTSLPGGFTDPTLPAGYAPFNIQNIGGKLYVLYAQQDASGVDEVAGAGLGVVDTFDTSGNFLGRFASGGALNAPWGIAQAPADFGRFSGDILIGNFGDGRINAYHADTGSMHGTLATAAGTPVVIDGLWALAFGNGAVAGDQSALYFTAGPAGETHGLLGKLAANHAPVLDNTLTPTLSTIDEDAVNPPGTSVASLIAGAVSDADPFAKHGIAIVTAAGTSAGHWQYTLNGGTSWQELGSPTESTARLLPDSAGAKVRFIPAADFNGTVKLYYRAWDRTQGALGGTLSTKGRLGGQNAFSTAFESATQTIKAINDSPALTLGGTISYTHDAAAIVLAPFATASDIDSPNFAGGQLKVRIGAGSSAANRLAIAGLFTVDASNHVNQGSTTIGTLNANGGQGTTDLVVTLNANATVAVVQQLVRSITFRTVAGAAGTRSVLFTVSDGVGGTSPEQTKTVKVT